MPLKRKGKSRGAIPPLLLLLTVLLPFIVSAPDVLALEVSEVTVDFPLSDVLDIQPEAAVTDTTAGGGDSAGSLEHPGAVARREPWEEDWFAYRQGILKGNLDEAEKRIEKIIAFKRDRGIPNLYAPAAALLVEASQATRQDRYDDAMDLVGFARLLAPDDPAPHFQRARTIWRQNKLRVLSAMDALLEGSGLFFRDLRSFLPWFFGLLLWFLTGLVLASIVTIFLFVPRVFPRMAHDLSHRIKLPQLVLLVALLLLLPAVPLLGVPFLFWIIAVALSMLAHLNNRERIAVGLAVLLLAGTPALVHVLTLAKSFYGPAGSISLYLVERGGEGQQAVETLHKLRLENPDEARIPAVTALVMKRGQRFREAESLLRQSLQLDPESASVHNNLANIMLHNRRIEPAIEQYVRALRYSDDPRIHYNLSQAYRENLQLDEGEKEFKIVQEMDPGFASMLVSLQKEGERRVTMDIYGSVGSYLKDALSLDQDNRAWRGNLWSAIMPGVPFKFAWAVFPVAAMLLFAGWPLGARKRFSHRCRKCNRLHCSACSQSSADLMCAQCRQIFMIRAGVDPASRVKKMMQIMRFQRRQSFLSRILTILLPGMGHIYTGAGWQSLVLITFTMLFWTKWVLWNGFFRNVNMLDIQSGATTKSVFGVLLFLFYLLALRGVGTRLEGK